MLRRAKIEVKGIVQGVGFRPFIYRLAKKEGLKGYVLNNPHGVEIDVEGEDGAIDRFIEEMKSWPPPLSKIVEINVKLLPPVFYLDFQIRESQTEEDRSTLISPDIAVCTDCLQELFDPKDRRYLYPFINCTNCGPRYTIIMDIPYDRPKTSMAVFKMCPDCQREYDDPLDRRFHAQPNACPICGPQVKFLDSTCKEVQTANPIEKAIEFLQAGKIVAIKGLGGFHLAVDATNDEAVLRLRERKYREEKPLAIMSPSLEKITEYAFVSPKEEELLSSPQRPIVLLRKKNPNPLSENVAPRNKYFGAMLPYTPLHYLIVKDNFLALVMTSGNISEEPIAIDNDEALKRLSGIADYYLVHNRDIYLRSDDSVLRVVDGVSVQIRRSRGYVPMPIFLKSPVPQILGVGGYLKNTICLTKGENAFLSQHIGDLENLETLRFFEKTIRHLERILQIEPEVLAYDLHPGYLSTQWALEQRGVELVGVQHHHAHIAACMAENGVEDKVIGIALDGTGYGIDENIWGGEILIADLQNFERVGHFEYVPMPGGEAAIKEPWRMAISYLYHTFGYDFWNVDIDFIRRIKNKKKEEAGTLIKMIAKEINAPLTSSCGRLFDGVAALLGIRERISFEGQAAMELEMAIEEENGESDFYDITIGDADMPLSIPIEPLIKGVVKDLMRQESISRISLRFHRSLVNTFVKICQLLRSREKLNRVALSGGCFQNVYLLKNLSSRLRKEGFEVFTHSLIPANDGGISLGQVVVAGKYYGKGSTNAMPARP